MKTDPKLTIALLAVLIMAVTQACRALISTGDENSTRSLPAPEKNEQNRGSNLITVRARDFTLTLQPSQPLAGEVTFVVNNEGRLPHDFRIRGNGVDHRTAIIEPQGSETFTLQLEPGNYDYQCTVEGHNMLGMKGSFSIEASSSN